MKKISTIRSVWYEARMTIRFVRFELRTTDESAARAFYEDLLEDRCPDVSPLPEPARARGLPPQWLGHVAVPDVRQALDQWVDLTQGA